MELRIENGKFIVGDVFPVPYDYKIACGDGRRECIHAFRAQVGYATRLGTEKSVPYTHRTPKPEKLPNS